jgi:hypothetical protein
MFGMYLPYYRLAGDEEDEPPLYVGYSCGHLFYYDSQYDYPPKCSEKRCKGSIDDSRLYLHGTCEGCGEDLYYPEGGWPDTVYCSSDGHDPEPF